jgi:glucose/arabinose dehydrogenase
MKNISSHHWLIGLIASSVAPLACGTSDSSEVAEVGRAAEALTSGTPLIGVASGRCLDVKGNSKTPGAALQIYQCNGGANQGFTFTAAGELRVYESTLCVEPKNGSTTLGGGTVVAIASCSGLPAQQWRLNADKSITATQSGLCLDVMSQGTANQTPVQLWTCKNQDNQRWNSTAADAQAPSAPSGLSLANVTCNSGTLSWAAATDNVAVTAYDVYHDGQLMRSLDGNARAAALTLAPGVRWGLYVNARDAAGNVSQASSTLYVTPPQCQADTQPPTAPANLSGSASGTSVALGWEASNDNVAVSAYDVFRGGVKVGTVAGTSTTPPAQSFTDSGLAPSTAYSYYVVARDAQSNVSARSNTISVTSGLACSNPICSVTQLATSTDVPWGLVTLPDGKILFSERDAQNVIRLDPVSGQKTTVGKVPNVQGTDGEGGLMGLALSPSFASDSWLYMMHTSPTDNRIVRCKYLNGVLDTSTLQVLLSGVLRNKFHNGGRLRFGPDGKLYASTGDAQNGANAQNTSGLNGKVLRLNADGSVPSDNPFGNYVWSYGHRNPQGLAFDSHGRLWEQEFGNSVMDETNLIAKGGNYGWPNCEGTSSQGGAGCATAGYLAPKRTYPTSEGSCAGIAIVRDVLYVACERGTRLYREVISGTSLTNVQQFFVGTYGRIRTVEPTLDGNLWMTTSNLGDKDSTPNNSNEKLFKVLLGG